MKSHHKKQIARNICVLIIMTLGFLFIMREIVVLSPVLLYRHDFEKKDLKDAKDLSGIKNNRK